MDQNGIVMEYWYRPPFGKHIKSYWTSPFFIGISFVNEQLSVVMLAYWGIEMISLNKWQHRPTSSNYEDQRSCFLLNKWNLKPELIWGTTHSSLPWYTHYTYNFHAWGFSRSGSLNHTFIFVFISGWYCLPFAVSTWIWYLLSKLPFLGNIFIDVVWQGDIFAIWNMLKASWCRMTCLDSNSCAVIPCLSTCLQAISLLGTADGLPPWLARNHSFSEMSFSSQAARCGESIWRQQKW